MSDVIKKPSIFEEKVKIGSQPKKETEKIDPVKEAEEKAKLIVESAKAEREKILKLASLLSKEIRDNAYLEGYKAGVEKANDEWKKKLSDFDEFMKSVKAKIDKSIDDLTPYLLELSITVIKEVVLSEVDPQSISKKIERVLQLVKSSKNVKIYVPHTLPDEILRDIRNGSVEIIVDSSFGPDDLKVEFDFGIMDLRVSSQLRFFEELMRKSFGMDVDRNG